MTKTEIKEMLRAATDADLADFYDVSRQAVAQWKEQAVPSGRVWELRARRPELFRASKTKNDS